MAAAILITGASRGLGFEFASQYVADGWRVFAACRCPAAATIIIAVLINSAGTAGLPWQKTGNVDYESWARVFNVNTMGPLRPCATHSRFQSDGSPRRPSR
jgi:NAD(P)-dependent dehydrogenase (short-subunit alcohol dehydrogenase family)